MRTFAVVARAFACAVAVLSAVLSPSVAYAQQTSAIRVGYYDMVEGHGATNQDGPIKLLAQKGLGFIAVHLTDLSAKDLATIHVLFVQNPSNTGYAKKYVDRLPEIQAAVRNGMVLVVHDRAVRTPTTSSMLPGAERISFSRGTSDDIAVSDRATAVGNGPGGVIDDSTLDGGNWSTHGWASLSTLPPDANSLLYTGSTDRSVTFSYPHGAGFVIYSAIPLDGHLNGTVTGANFRNIYAPNVIAYAAMLRTEKLTVEPATGQYGATTTLTATLRAGTTAHVGKVIEFALDGSPVGSAVTDSEGVATLGNVNLAPGGTPIPAGTYVAHVRASSNAGGASATNTLTVSKAPATVTVAGGSFVYDGLPHDASATATGVLGDSLPPPAITYTAADGVTSSAPPVAVGTYTVNATSAEGENYLSTTNSSHTITITPAALTVQANNKTRVYGDRNPGFDVAYSGFVADEGPHVLGGTLVLDAVATETSDAGVYAITPSGLTSANYTITFVPGTLTIDPAPLTVTADDAKKQYGAPMPSFTATYTGFVLGQGPAVLSGALTFTTPADHTSNVGQYPARPDGLVSRNYAITFVNGTLTVTPVALTVTAAAASKLLGAPLPAFTATYSGFVLGQGPGALAGALTFSTPATPSSPVGTYTVTPGGLLSSNYAVDFRPSTLTVSYNVCLLYDPMRRHNSGSTVPIKLQLCDASRANVSSPSTIVHATGLVQTSSTSSGPVEDSGDANPDDDFRFADGAYRFNLKTNGSMGTGSYELRFAADGDPTTYSVSFQIR